MISDRQKLYVNIFMSILVGLLFLVFVGLSIYYIIIKNYVLLYIGVFTSIVLFVCTLMYIIKIFKLIHKKINK